LSEISNSSLNNNNKITIKTKCTNFLKILAKTLMDKLPDNFQVIQKMKNFFPSNCLNQLRPSIDQLPFEFKEHNVDINDIDSQWRNLINID